MKRYKELVIKLQDGNASEDEQKEVAVMMENVRHENIRLYTTAQKYITLLKEEIRPPEWKKNGKKI